MFRFNAACSGYEVTECVQCELLLQRTVIPSITATVTCLPLGLKTGSKLDESHHDVLALHQPIARANGHLAA